MRNITPSKSLYHRVQAIKAAKEAKPAPPPVKVRIKLLNQPEQLFDYYDGDAVIKVIRSPGVSMILADIEEIGYKDIRKLLASSPITLSGTLAGARIFGELCQEFNTPNEWKLDLSHPIVFNQDTLTGRQTKISALDPFSKIFFDEAFLDGLYRLLKCFPDEKWTYLLD